MKQPNFSSCICIALEVDFVNFSRNIPLQGIEPLQEEFIANFGRVLKLNVAQELTLALGLAYSADNNVRQEGEPLHSAADSPSNQVFEGQVAGTYSQRHKDTPRQPAAYTTVLPTFHGGILQAGREPG